MTWRVERQAEVSVLKALLLAVEGALKNIGLWPAGGSNSAGIVIIFFVSRSNEGLCTTIKSLAAIFETFVS